MYTPPSTCMKTFILSLTHTQTCTHIRVDQSSEPFCCVSDTISGGFISWAADSAASWTHKLFRLRCAPMLLLLGQIAAETITVNPNVGLLHCHHYPPTLPASLLHSGGQFRTMDDEPFFFIRFRSASQQQLSSFLSYCFLSICAPLSLVFYANLSSSVWVFLCAHMSVLCSLASGNRQCMLAESMLREDSFFILLALQ